MHSMLWWSLFSRSMKMLTALIFSHRVWKGWAWHDETPREEVHFPSSSKAAQVTDMRTVHAVMLEESNYCNSFYCHQHVSCPLTDVWSMYAPCLTRRMNCFPSFLRAMETHRQQHRRCHECMREGLKSTACMTFTLVLLLFFNTYLRGFCRIQRAS